MMKMFKKKVLHITENNARGCLLLCGLYLLGCVLALILGTDGASEEEIRLYFSDFIRNTKLSGVEASQTFRFSMAHYAQYAIAMFFFSMTVIGMPAILLLTIAKGFSFGVVLSCLFQAFGAKSFLILLCAVFPHCIFAAPCCVTYGLCCLNNAKSLSDGIRFRQHVLRPFLFGLLFLGLVSIAALLQTFVEPLFISWISAYFM